MGVYGRDQYGRVYLLTLRYPLPLGGLLEFFQSLFSPDRYYSTAQPRPTAKTKNGQFIYGQNDADTAPRRSPSPISAGLHVRPISPSSVLRERRFSILSK
jgi:hypothetical protein